MNSHDIFELQQAYAEQDYFLNQALDRLAERVPLTQLEPQELAALTDRCLYLQQDRDIMTGIACTEPF